MSMPLPCNVARGADRRRQPRARTADWVAASPDLQRRRPDDDAAAGGFGH